MRDIKFKFVFRYAEAGLTQISRPYTLDELINNKDLVTHDYISTLKEIAAECVTCECASIKECNCDEIFDHFELIDRIEWSGILDTHGVEIYEGDIVRDGDNDRYLIKFGQHDVPVDYHDGTAFGWYKERINPGFCDEWPLLEYIVKEDKTTVIGNRFQHPELLNAK